MTAHGSLARLPEGWDSVQLRRVASLQNGADYKSVEVEDGGYPVYGSGGEFRRASRFLYDGESVLFGRKGTIDRPLYVTGKFWTVDTMFYSRLSPKILGRFLYYSATTIPYAYYSTSTALPSMTQGDLAGHTIPLPPLDEQRAIADFLDEQTSRIDTLIAKQARLIDTLRERRAAVMLRAVTKGVRPPGAMRPSGLRWAGDVPEEWDVANIRRYAAMKTGHTPSRSTPEYWLNCSIPWVTLADVWQLRSGRSTFLSPDTQTQISELGLANSAAELLPPGTVVLSRTASVGFSGIMPTSMATSQDYWNWVCGPRLLPTYLLATFRAMQDEFRSLVMGSTHKTIYQPIAAGISIVVPSVEEQREIVAYLDEQTSKIDVLIAKAQQHIALAKERRAALIAAAVTGQIDVRTASRAATVVT